MFRLLKFLFVLVIGIYLGFQGNLMLMRAECSNAGGDWSGTVCFGAGQ
ncbi:hypothetical protein KDD17_12710 [Sulfitobacter albidus]|uniref:Uncharacterized protein n=1 Tax=Sulfitobacter albidus TaxID=2829501 RepID=A0A975PLL1_9RHOB|nr:hypothetical protein [Sulfitobacter albidus]QUJ75799.1 hypothetical protein KDD17_12710 [Sulfitobacter albidus]